MTTILIKKKKKKKHDKHRDHHHDHHHNHHNDHQVRPGARQKAQLMLDSNKKKDTLDLTFEVEIAHIPQNCKHCSNYRSEMALAISLESCERGGLSLLQREKTFFGHCDLVSKKKVHVCVLASWTQSCPGVESIKVSGLKTGLKTIPYEEVFFYFLIFCEHVFSQTSLHVKQARPSFPFLKNFCLASNQS